MKFEENISTDLKNKLQTSKLQTPILYIATYNVRSLVEPSRQTELDHALEGIKWDVLGLSEVKKEGYKITEYENYIMMYTGSKSGTNGVGFLVKKSLRENIKNFHSYSDRVARLDSQFDSTTINIIQVYAPTKKADLEILQKFYEEVGLALQDSTKDTLIIGDFNAKIGSRKTTEQRTMGSWGYGDRNSRGETLVQFCIGNEMSIANTFFRKRDKMRRTWQSPSRKTKMK